LFLDKKIKDEYISLVMAEGFVSGIHSLEWHCLFIATPCRQNEQYVLRTEKSIGAKNEKAK